jgi:hypothetical protein
MAHDHDDDPALAEAIARRDESRAQILRGKANANPAYEQLAAKAEKDAAASARAADGIPEPKPDPEGTAQLLADSEGNFAANADVAAVGGTGIKASNTDVSTGQPAQTVEQAGVAVTEGAQKIVGDQPVGNATTSRTTETAGTRAAVVIPDGWRDLSWQERRSIASKLSDTPISNGEEANAAIEAELKRRGA